MTDQRISPPAPASTRPLTCSCYTKEMHQVTIYATITISTPDTVAAILSGSEPPPHQPVTLSTSQ